MNIKEEIKMKINLSSLMGLINESEKQIAFFKKIAFLRFLKDFNEGFKSINFERFWRPLFSRKALILLRIRSKKTIFGKMQSRKKMVENRPFFNAK